MIRFSLGFSIIHPDEIQYYSYRADDEGKQSHAVKGNQNHRHEQNIEDKRRPCQRQCTLR